MERPVCIFISGQSVWIILWFLNVESRLRRVLGFAPWQTRVNHWRITQCYEQNRENGDAYKAAYILYLFIASPPKEKSIRFCSISSCHTVLLIDFLFHGNWRLDMHEHVVYCICLYIIYTSRIDIQYTNVFYVIFYYFRILFF